MVFAFGAEVQGTGGVGVAVYQFLVVQLHFGDGGAVLWAAQGPEAWRLEKAKAIAGGLDARVDDGLSCFLPLYRAGRRTSRRVSAFGQPGAC